MTVAGIKLADALFERDRLARLHAYEIMDTPAERDFDDIATLAAELCGTPIALISLVDGERQWFKARVGLDSCQTPRDTSFCAHAMLRDDVMQVHDARTDPRFAANPLVTGEPFIRFYAGAPLVSASGHPLGSLCVIGREPGRLGEQQVSALRTLARHVVVELELREYARHAELAGERLRAAERVKDEFLARVTHELRTPLTSIHGYLEILDQGDVPSEAAGQFMATIRRNSDRLLTLVDDMLLAAELTGGDVRLDRRRIDLATLAAVIAEEHRDLASAKGLTVTVDAPAAVLVDADSGRLTQALERLVLNAVKFTARGGVAVRVAVRDGRAFVDVADTGIGIRAADHDRLFAPFRRAGNAEEAEIQGTGLGLAIVKAVVDAHGGTIEVHSVERGGTTITVGLPLSR